MKREPSVHVGELGWSNKRNGVEFYARMPDHSNGRHSRRPGHGQETEGWGALLIEEMDPKMSLEGGHVVVVVLPDRGTRPAEVDIIADRIRELVAPRAKLWERFKTAVARYRRMT